MLSFSVNRNRAKLKQLLGIRARLALLAIILVTPLMLERVRSLEGARAKQIAAMSAEFSGLAKRSADAQAEVISSVETVLKSAAYIRASAGVAHSCDFLRASLPARLPWIRNVMIAGHDGRIQCSTNNTFIGLDLSDRDYFKRAVVSRDVVFSDFLIWRPTQQPTLIAAYPVSAISEDSDAIILASINLDWMSKIMSNLSDRPGISAALVDSAGKVLAAPSDQASTIGRTLDGVPFLSAMMDTELNSGQEEGSVEFKAADGSKRAIGFTRITGPQSRLIVLIDEEMVNAGINRELRTAYLQLGFVILFILLGAFIAAEKLIIQPIDMLAAVAKRFGAGDWSARAARNGIPAEFVSLARAFNAMAAKLAQRERDLLATNDRLTVIASVDMLSGLANRRGFQSRLEFEWMKAQQYGSELSLLMIDVDHFKLYNDSYGHPEGDTCLSKVGETLAAIAAETKGFAARYGGEEFCLLLPNTGAGRAIEIAEMLRAAVLTLALPHATSNHQIVTVSIGVGSTRPSDSLTPGDLIESADTALYAAKRRGRNTVVEHGFVQITDFGDSGSELDLSVRGTF